MFWHYENDSFEDEDEEKSGDRVKKQEKVETE